MKQFKYAPLAAMLAVIPQVQAQGPLDEGTIPFAYLNQPFGGTTQSQSIPSFGLGVTQGGGSASGTLNLLNPERPPLFNLEYKGENLAAINLNGNNVLDIMARFGYDANGEQSFAEWLDSLTQQQKVALGLGVGLAVWCVADFCHSHGGNNSAPSSV